MTTTIQISEESKKILNRMKLYQRETYNDVIDRMIEDELELNERTKKELEEARKQVRTGKVISHEEVKRRLGL